MLLFVGFPLLLLHLSWFLTPGAQGTRSSRASPVFMNQFAVHIPNGPDIADVVASKYGFQNLGQIGSLKNFYLFEHQHVHRRSLTHSQEHHDNLYRDPAVTWFEQQHEKKRKKRDFATNFGSFLDNLESLPLTIHHGPQRYRTIGHIETFSDPLFKEQWYLNGGAKDGHDMNVAPAWQRGYTGKGVVVSILDDGIQTNHPDLAMNYDRHASTDINDNDNDPMPRDNGDNKHGTRCAGEVAAVAFNGYCGVGVAYNASIGGVRMLDGTVNDAVEAKALGLNPEHIDIYSASWGPEDDGKTVDGPGPLARRAFIYGVTSGRKGKGSIFIWASGNGGRHIDSCNCDGYTNSIFTVSISSATQGGYKPWYLEECSSTLATTYSSGTPGHDKSVATVDMDGKLRPDHICTAEHTGTSASAPLAAGITALALEANPSLTWRDMQYLVILSSKSSPLEKETGWSINGVKRKVSHKFGYGLMDAGAMVTLAEQWTNVPPQHICKSQEINEERQLDPTLGAILTVHMDVTGCANTLNEVRFLEHVQCKISLRFFPRGNIRILLTSPMGTTSTLLFERPRDVVSSNFDDWPFLSVHYWGEKSEGRWTLQIINGGTRHVNQPGFLKKWQLIFYGTATNPIRLRNNNAPSSFTPIQPPSSSGSFLFPNNHRPSTNDVPFYSSSTEGGGSGVFGSNGFTGFTNIFNVAGSNPQVAIAPLDRSPNGDYSGQQHNLMNVEESGKKILHICDPECDTQGCYGKGPTQCVACKHYKLDNSCVSRCPPRSFPNQAGQCWPCHESCETCAGPGQDSCLTCAPAHLRVTDLAVCLQQCPEGYFENYDEELCVPCESNCASCLERPDHCTSCDHHLVLHKNKCYASCPLYTYETEDYECADCHSSCETCNGSSETQCVSCKPGRYSLLGTCVNRCPTGYYADKKRRECLPCPPGCSSCSTSLCFACELGWVIHKNRCLPEGSTKCDSAEFSEAGRCRPCHSTCEQCVGAGPSDCLTCTNPLLLSGQQCVATCPRGTYPHRTDCLPCLHTCTECEARANCTACVSSLHLQSGECRASCAQGYYSDRGVCAKCYLSCHTCSGPRRDQCVTCPKSWQLAAGECHPECPEGFFKTQFGCQKCHHYCRTCNGEGPLQCTTCPAKYMLEGGLCMECLGSQYYDPPTQLCKSCHETCRQCNGPGPFSCLGCLFPLHLDKLNNQCVPCCPPDDGNSGSNNFGNQTPSLNSLAFSSQNCCHCDKTTGECQNSSPAGKRRIAAGADRLLSSSALNSYERTSVSESFNVVPTPQLSFFTDTIFRGAFIIIMITLIFAIFYILLLNIRARNLRYNGNSTVAGYEKLPTQLKVEVNDSNAIALSDDYEEEEDEANPLYMKT